MNAERADNLIAESLAGLESGRPDPQRTDEARQRVLAHFDDLVQVAGEPSDSEPEVGEVIRVSPDTVENRRRRPLAAVAALFVVLAGVFAAVRLGSDSSIDVVDTDTATDSVPDHREPAPHGLGELSSQFPAFLETTTESDEVITLESPDTNIGFVLVATEPNWSLEDRLNELVADDAVVSTRRATSVQGEAADFYEVFASASSIQARGCAVSEPCAPLLADSDQPTWLRAAYHHHVMVVQRSDAGPILFIAYTDQPFSPDFAPLVTEMLEVLSN